MKPRADIPTLPSLQTGAEHGGEVQPEHCWPTHSHREPLRRVCVE